MQCLHQLLILIIITFFFKLNRHYRNYKYTHYKTIIITKNNGKLTLVAARYLEYSIIINYNIHLTILSSD